MQLLGNVGEFILTGIHQVAIKIKQTVERVKANRYQCTRFSERVDTIVGFLDLKDEANPFKTAIRKALHNFHIFLQRCLKFIKKFADAGWFGRIWRNSNYAEQFRMLNEELTHHCQDLNFGLAITLYQIFSAEDDNDAQHDLEEISEMVNSQVPLISRKTQRNPTFQAATNISGRIIPTTHLKHQSHTMHDSLQRPRYVFYPMYRVVRGYGPFVPNYFYR